MTSPFYILKLPLLFEKDQHSYPNSKENSPYSGVGPLPAELWHELEVHSVYTCDEGKRDE